MKAGRLFVIAVSVPVLLIVMVVYQSNFSFLAEKTKQRQALLKNMKPGKTKEEIISILGTPDVIDSIIEKDFIIYRYKMPILYSDAIEVTFLNDSTVSYYDGN